MLMKIEEWISQTVMATWIGGSIDPAFEQANGPALVGLDIDK